jgi:type IV secretory pathway TrbD component
MFRLRHIVYMMTNAVIVGGMLILVLSLGLEGWLTMFGSVVVGFIVAWPVARLIARWIKIEDPAWNATRDRPVAAERKYRAARARGLPPDAAEAAARR